MVARTSCSIGLIVNTYNQPDYLQRVLRSISAQAVLPDEVLIADDGSKEKTREVIDAWKAANRVACRHMWQPDEGFQRARILNESIAHATADYLVFLDGDTVAHPDFIRDHRDAARLGHFVQGHRCFVERRAADQFGQNDFRRDRLAAFVRGQISGLRNAFRWPRPLLRVRNDVKGVRGCNLAIWHRDLVAVNGYNEAFVGWGREDTELTVRLLNRGLNRVDLRGRALCFHLWHPPANRSQLSRNDCLLAQAKAERAKWCPRGLDQHSAGAELMNSLRSAALAVGTK
ncbi:MAG TPA: glycosyltransferase family 2 protein [Verrucomicrobiae bacterium]|nr:glycosyltransferase family 2 protein [Verrucomicrobiae bacterium]